MAIFDWEEFEHPPREYSKYYLRIDDADKQEVVLQQILSWKSAEQIKVVDLRTHNQFDSTVVESILALPKLKSYELYTTQYIKPYATDLRSILSREKYNLMFTYHFEHQMRMLITLASKEFIFWGKSRPDSTGQSIDEAQLDNEIIKAIYTVLSEDSSSTVYAAAKNLLHSNLFQEQRNDKFGLVSLTHKVW